MIALLCAAALLPQQDAKVTLQVPATGLATILKRVSDATSVPLTVDSKFAEMPLVISVKDVPLSEFLTQVGASTELDVKTNAGGFRLMRTAERQSKLSDAQIKEAEAMWTESILRARKEYEAAPWSTKFAESLIADEKKRGEERRKQASQVQFEGTTHYDWWQSWKPGISEHRPSARLAFRILQAIGPKALARLPKDRPVVISRYPTSMQVAMPPQIEQFLAQYTRESALNPIVEKQWGEGMPYATGRSPGESDLGRVSGPIGKVLLNIQSRGPYAAVRLFSKDGTHADAGMFGQFSMYQQGEGAEPHTEPEHEREKLEWFQLSSLSRELIEYTAVAEDYEPDTYNDNGNAQPEAPHISRELRNALLNPEQRDPLAYVVSEAFLEYASQKRLNVIVRLGEYSGLGRYVEPEAFGKDGLVNPEAVVHDILHDRDPPGASEKPGWVVRGVDDPLSEETRFVSRRAIGRFVRSVALNGANFEAEIEFASALSSFNAFFLSLDHPVFTYLRTQGFDPWIFRGPRLQLSGVLGALSPPQRLAATRDGIRASQMTPAQLTRLHELLYSNRSRLGSLIHDDDESPDLMAAFDASQRPAYLLEPTELLPNGVPPETILTIRTKGKDSIESPDGDSHSAKDLAFMLLIARKFPNVEGASDYTESLPKMVRATTTITHTVKVKVETDYLIGERYDFHQRKGGDRYTPLDSPAIRVLLDPWLRRFQNFTYEQLEEAYTNDDQVTHDS